MKGFLEIGEVVARGRLGQDSRQNIEGLIDLGDWTESAVQAVSRGTGRRS